ncbi:MAG: DUF2961 domain-containing protein [Chloroflexi bacterium]|uniref:DUF2961 domain-containing protein n=1 Tax=Candidatus Chlorohelix allophototropha TaxID=3003348 RepID=A0A8T7M5L0_9CHLR|nr:DUF2961 domain-containing protein [Chloroflexota bacterium]WJW69277.1 DUF2961 domain-containing protein [Chloroflexota bacterium L227-S17]
MKKISFLLLMFELGLLTLSAYSPPLTKASTTPNFIDTSFADTWNRSDKAVSEMPGVGRGYTWGPEYFTDKAVYSEAYNQGNRQVQYFDKARMEINSNAKPGDLFYVTTGLLVKELVTGMRQDGDTTFTPYPPSNIQVAGDPNDNGLNAIAPTYASFRKVITFNGTENSAPNRVSAIISENIDRSGTVKSVTPPEVRYLKTFDNNTNHNIADVFVDFGNQNGLVWQNNSFIQDSVFYHNPTYVLGLPVTEPYWTQAMVGGELRDVLVQLFERRTLTYTPSNPPGFKVEMGNVGQHYFRWRYLENNTQSTPATTPSTPTTADISGLDFGSNALTNLYNLPNIGAYTQTYVTSSHDPYGGNWDRTNVLYREGDSRYVIFDEKGAGSIYRIWMTKEPTNDTIGNILFYFDDEDTPRVNLNYQDFFSGKTAPFLTPLVGNNQVSSGGFYSYVPISYGKRLKIVTTKLPEFFQIDYQRLAGVANVPSFTGKEDLSSLVSYFSGVGADPKPANPGRQLIKGSGTLNGNGELILPQLQGPAVISSIKLKMNFNNNEVVAQTNLKIWWDKRPWTQVDAPLDFFFGSAEGEQRVNGLLAGMDPTTHQYYFYLPMPFRSEAKISLANHSTTPATVEWEIAVDPDPDGKLVKANTGYFNATFKDQSDLPDGSDYKVLNLKNTRGKFVGLVMRYWSHYSAMEGDDRVYIDGSATPHIYGTGFEDFFNGGWGFEKGPFSLPLHGSMAPYWPPPFPLYFGRSGYRFMLGDAITFNSALEFGFEHGYMGKNTGAPNENYRSLAFWYGLDNSTLQLTDSLNVGPENKVAETAHSYTATGKDFSGRLDTFYEGDRYLNRIGDDGYKLHGYSEFTISIQPDNNGVILRRRMDYGDLNQQGRVYVDGQPVGLWYSAGQFTSSIRWRDEDFVIPTSFTTGKSSIKVRIENASTSPWSEFYYWVYTLKKGLGYLPGNN